MMGLERYFAVIAGKEKAKYLIAKKSGVLDKKISEAEKLMEKCGLCERKCGVNRLRGEKGFCGVGKEMKVFSAFAHFGEEPELVPSATVFLSGCTLRCVFCQNAPESIDPDSGNVWDPEDVAKYAEKMYSQGCTNLNFVGGEPTPNLLGILKSLKACNTNLPVVWNSNAYYSEKTSKILEGFVDLYLLDFKYFNNKCATRLSAAPGYLGAAKRNLLNASRDSEVLIRHLVLPSHTECCTKPFLRWVYKSLGENTRLNIMDQYYPAFKAHGFEEINRRLDPLEFENVVKYAKKIGLKNLV